MNEQHVAGSECVPPAGTVRSGHEQDEPRRPPSGGIAQK